MSATANLTPGNLTDDQLDMLAEKIFRRLDRRYDVKEKPFPDSCTVLEAAEFLGKSREMIYVYLNTGRLSKIPKTSPIRIKRSDVERLHDEIEGK